MTDLLLRAARGERTERPPVWLMRQAGRHLPEYRELRADYSFREAIETPAVAAEITLQPWERYRPDGLVIFSDILTVLEPLGFDYHLESGVGPVIENPVDEPADVDRPRRDVRTDLAFVGELLERLDDTVGAEVPLIGFAGGPFTLASYAIAGGADRNHRPLRKLRARHPARFQSLLEQLADVIHDHLAFQINAGADVVQLFDTYAGYLTAADYREFLLPLHRRIFEGLSAPTIVFARGMGGRLDLLADAGADVVSLDWRVDMETARDRLGDVPVQGNLDPSFLYADPALVRERTGEIIEAGGPAGHILNLGHGVHKDTPVAGVEAFIETAKATER
jgi:uroporphyrinogen decarboxylase